MSLAEDEPDQHPAGQRHQEVEGTTRQRRGHQVDVGRRIERFAIRANVEDRDVAGCVEAPEPGKDQHQADRHHPRVVWRDVADLPVRTEFPDAWADHYDHGQGRASGDGMDDPGRIRIVVAHQLDHPAVRGPSPGGGEDPKDGSDCHGHDEKPGGPRSLDDGARDDRGRRPREEQEGGPKHTCDPVAHVRPHQRGPWVEIVSEWVQSHASVDERAVDEREVDPPPEGEERHGHDGDDHDVLDQYVLEVLAPRHADLVAHEADVDEEHEYDRYPVVELGEQDVQGIGEIGHTLPPLIRVNSLTIS